MLTQQEPTVLPARVPHLLVNGAAGIAVGIATNIPPHNLREVVDGLCALIHNPDITVKQLMQHIPAPDFPTGTRGSVSLSITGCEWVYEQLRTPQCAQAARSSRLSPLALRITTGEVPSQCAAVYTLRKTEHPVDAA